VAGPFLKRPVFDCLKAPKKHPFRCQVEVPFIGFFDLYPVHLFPLAWLSLGMILASLFSPHFTPELSHGQGNGHFDRFFFFLTECGTSPLL